MNAPDDWKRTRQLDLLTEAVEGLSDYPLKQAGRQIEEARQICFGVADSISSMELEMIEHEIQQLRLRLEFQRKRVERAILAQGAE